MRVDLTEEGDDLIPSTPVEVIRFDVLRYSPYPRHAVDHDNERVLVMAPAEPDAMQARDRIHVVLNWFDTFDTDN